MNPWSTGSPVGDNLGIAVFFMTLDFVRQSKGVLGVVSCARWTVNQQIACRLAGTFPLWDAACPLQTSCSTHHTHARARASDRSGCALSFPMCSTDTHHFVSRSEALSLSHTQDDLVSHTTCRHFSLTCYINTSDNYQTAVTTATAILFIPFGWSHVHDARARRRYVQVCAPCSYTYICLCHVRKLTPPPPPR